MRAGLRLLSLLQSVPRRPRPRWGVLTTRAMSQRSYNDAIDCLNSLQSNAAALEASRASGGRLVEFAIPEMVESLERIGYNVSLFRYTSLTSVKLGSVARRPEQVECGPRYWHQGEGVYVRVYRLDTAYCDAWVEDWLVLTKQSPRPYPHSVTQAYSHPRISLPCESVSG